MQDWSEGFIAVDWGTTNRRAYRLDRNGAVIAEMEDDAGAATLAAHEFPGAVARITEQLGPAPLLLAGMVGSNRGWREAPYVPCPASLADLARHLLWVEPGRVAIVPGVSWTAPGKADVMRGEEVQVLGYFQRDEPGPALLCHPGTHTKWVRVAGGAITGFRTFMTGELFALLRDHSILAPLLHGDTEPDADFCAGAEIALAGGDLAAELFSARARVLLGQLDPACAAAWVSGLLVGADVRGGLATWRPEPPRTVVVLGRPSLNRLYAAALAHAGVQAVCIDGAGAFVAGMNALAKALP